LTRDTELAWAAGFYEGEGSLSISTLYKGKKRCPECKQFHFRTIRLSVPQHESTRLVRFQEAVGYGKIRGPYIVEAKTPRWVWNNSGVHEVRPILKLLWPYFTPFTRAKTKAVLVRWDNRHLSRPSRVKMPIDKGF
jgi:hypothetical protein